MLPRQAGVSEDIFEKMSNPPPPPGILIATRPAQAAEFCPWRSEPNQKNRSHPVSQSGCGHRLFIFSLFEVFQYGLVRAGFVVILKGRL
jgi:hypothetical protein